MIISEEIKKSIIQDYEVEAVLKFSRHTDDILKAQKKLSEEINEKLDEGIPFVDIVVELKNRLWRMKKDEIDTQNPEYIALNTVININQEYYAEQFFQSKGWKKKFSGEWVRI